MMLVRTDSDNADFRQLVKELDEFLAEVDGDEHAYYAQFNRLDNIQNVVIVYEDSEPIGCGAFKSYAETVAEVKRMFVRLEHRGKGAGAALLVELEAWAVGIGYSECILETGHRQTAAVRLYQAAGYKVIPNYGQYAGVDSSVCMTKKLTVDNRAGV